MLGVFQVTSAAEASIVDAHSRSSYSRENANTVRVTANACNEAELEILPPSPKLG